MDKIVAAVDLGSNSFHMKVARANGESLVVLDRMRDMVQLAAGLDGDDELSGEAMDRAIGCLERFEQRLRGLPAEDVRAVGTNTLRKARNARDFLSRAESALNHPIEVIAGREEARLIYLGVAHTANQPEAQRLVVDIGGGSTEFIIGRRFTPIVTESLYMGCVGMSRDHFPSGEITPKRMRRAEVAALQELEPIQQAYRRVGWDVALGSSGTILTVERILREQGWEPSGISLLGLDRLRAALLELGHVDRLRLADVRPERAAVLPGGVAILRAVMEALAIERLHRADGALREGLLYDLVGRLEHVDAREATIRELCARHGVDELQAARVEQTALLLRAQLASAWRLRKERLGDVLGWAARLHEIGLAIAHNQYHKHGAYMVQHGDMPGFSREEQTMLAVLVRAHRRKFPVRAFDSLREPSAERLRRLAIILRLAVVLHRSRVDDPLPRFSAEAQGETLKLAFPREWLRQHPLTEADLALEAAFLRPAGLRLAVR